jgi:uncharacterized protein with HEPN domain
MSKRDFSIYFLHMRDHAQEAARIAEGRQRVDLDREPMLRYALLHLICILGEAANRIPEPRRSAYPAIPWRDIIGMRNALIHGYDSVNKDRLWNTVQMELPRLIGLLNAAISDMRDTEGER